MIGGPDGSATISLAGGDEVVAEPDAKRLGFAAQVPPGSEIAVVHVENGCGNSTI